MRCWIFSSLYFFIFDNYPLPSPVMGLFEEKNSLNIPPLKHVKKTIKHLHIKSNVLNIGKEMRICWNMLHNFFLLWIFIKKKGTTGKIIYKINHFFHWFSCLFFYIIVCSFLHCHHFSDFLPQEAWTLNLFHDNYRQIWELYIPLS